MSGAVIPQGWARTTLGEVGRYLNGRAFKADEWSSRGRMIIRIQDLTGSGDAPNYFEGRVEPRYEVHPGDLLISWAATLGAFIWRGPEAVLNQHIFKVESHIDRAFHFYLVTHILDDLRRQAHGSGMVHITKGKFDSTPLLLPPLAEQRRIVAALEEHLSDLDAAMAGLERAKQRIARLRESVLAVTFQDDAWPQVRLADLIATGPDNGLYLPKDAYGSGTPILRIDDFQNDWSRGTNELRRVQTDEITRAKYTLRIGDLVVNRVNSPSHLGKCLVVEERHLPALFESNMMRMHLHETANPHFVALFLRSPQGRARLTSNAKWAVNQASINQSDVGNTLVPLPAADVQGKVVEGISAQIAIASRAAVEIGVQLARGARLRQAILKRAFEGKLLPQDPNDEPASALLASLRDMPSAALRGRGGRTRTTARRGRD